MSNDILVSYEKDIGHKIPSIWRETIYQIVEAFKDSDLESLNHINGVRNIALEDAKEIASNIKEYGEILISLPIETWSTSECQRVGESWQVFIDLFTEAEGRSDLVLFIVVFEKEGKFDFEIQDIYVP